MKNIKPKLFSLVLLFSLALLPISTLSARGGDHGGGGGGGHGWSGGGGHHSGGGDWDHHGGGDWGHHGDWNHGGDWGYGGGFYDGGGLYVYPYGGSGYYNSDSYDPYYYDSTPGVDVYFR